MAAQIDPAGVYSMDSWGDLERTAKGKVCVKCRSDIQVVTRPADGARLMGFRCHCHPDSPGAFVKPPHPITERYAQMVETEEGLERERRDSMALQPVETREIAPREVIAQATEQADALMGIVEDRKLYAMIEGKKYLEAEAWSTIGAFNRVHAITEWVNLIERDGVEVGYMAKVSLVHSVTGANHGTGIMSCGFEEFPCRGKTGMAQHKSAMSAAQTWATSKAYRMNYSWVAVLAGFQPTPAEEMAGNRPAKQSGSGNRPAKQEEMDWCEEHQTEWFKRGRMRNYAHPVGEGTAKSWCNMPKDPAPVLGGNAVNGETGEIVSSGDTPATVPESFGDFWAMAGLRGKGASDVRSVLGVNLTDYVQNESPTEDKAASIVSAWEQCVTAWDNKVRNRRTISLDVSTT